MKKKMKRNRIFLTIVSAVLVFVMSFCSACSLDDLINGTHEHSFVTYVSDNNATCTKNGTETA
ncbi:MAG: hypothetical protein K2N23_02570, partial [Clostridia bacterium]|nr:hypothetical protein [Clostridia bacterium]